MTSKECKRHVQPVRDTLQLIGGKWVYIIVNLLYANGTMRFGEIGRAIADVSAKMLTKELRELEQNQIITRQEMPTRPITVEYALTERGKTLVPLLHAIQDWGKQHRSELMQKETSNLEPAPETA